MKPQQAAKNVKCTFCGYKYADEITAIGNIPPTETCSNCDFAYGNICTNDMFDCENFNGWAAKS